MSEVQTIEEIIANLGSIEQNDPELYNTLMQVYIDYMESLNGNS
jgi:hypothetical protein